MITSLALLWMFIAALGLACWARRSRQRSHARALLADDARRRQVLKAVAAAEYRERTKESRMH